MKIFVVMFFLLASGSRAACLQGSFTVKSGGVINARKIEDAIDAFRLSLETELPSDHHLIIRMDSLNLRVNADIVKNGNELTIRIMGGMIRHELMSPEAMLLLLCHEIGHFLGGSPFKSRNGWSSTEGQSDYFSGFKCAQILGFDEASFIDAAIALTGIYAQVGREPLPRLDSCDETTVERTNFGYPNAQCRLDTLLAGWAGKERPRCWFRE